MKSVLIACLLVLGFGSCVVAQDLRVVTVTRSPFSLEQDGVQTGFSLDLWDALMADLGRSYEIDRVDAFADMLGAIENGTADAAVANISITANREEVMDFSHPIFEAGLQIMVPFDSAQGSSILDALLSRELLLAMLAAFVVLVGAGMLMWYVERRRQPYFDLPAREAVFPAFWWALNLIVNGGFEERIPRSPFGRIFGALLVVSSLFFVSAFVAKITSMMTVEAITSSVTSVNDLYGKEVGTTAGSTAAAFMDRRELRHDDYSNLTDLLEAFEAGQIDAVVFDAPILAHYVNTSGKGIGRLVGPVFLRENYGIALPTGSTLTEPINRSLLRLREDGTYEELRRKWFGAALN